MLPMCSSTIDFFLQATTTKQFEEQDNANQILKKYLFSSPLSFLTDLHSEMSTWPPINYRRAKCNYAPCTELSGSICNIPNVHVTLAGTRTLRSREPRTAATSRRANGIVRSRTARARSSSARTVNASDSPTRDTRSSLQTDSNKRKRQAPLYWTTKRKKRPSSIDQNTYVCSFVGNVFSVYCFGEPIQAHEQTGKETESLKTLMQRHDELLKELEERSQLLKTLEDAIEAIGKESVPSSQPRVSFTASATFLDWRKSSKRLRKSSSEPRS